VVNLTLVNRIDAAALSERPVQVAICRCDAVPADHAVGNGSSVTIHAATLWCIAYRLIVRDHAVGYGAADTVNACANLSLSSGDFQAVDCGGDAGGRDIKDAEKRGGAALHGQQTCARPIDRQVFVNQQLTAR